MYLGFNSHLFCFLALYFSPQVQRLLAGSPDISIDEIYFGVGHMNLECDADALASHGGLVGKKENVGDALGKQIVV